MAKHFIFLILALFFVTCTKLEILNTDNSIELRSCSVYRNIIDYQLWGELHNSALMNVHLNFTDTAQTNIDTFLNRLSNFTKNYFIDNGGIWTPSELANIHIISENYKWFPHKQSLIDSLNSTSFFNEIDILLESGLINNSEKILLERMKSCILDNLNDNLTSSSFIDSINEIKNSWDLANFCYDEKFGQISGVALNITLNSIEFWTTNHQIANITKDELEIRALPPWLAMDAAGALVGAAMAGLNAPKLDPTWKDLGTGAAKGAVLGSTGLVRKISTGILRHFGS